MTSHFLSLPTAVRRNIEPSDRTYSGLNQCIEVAMGSIIPNTAVVVRPAGSGGGHPKSAATDGSGDQEQHERAEKGNKGESSPGAWKLSWARHQPSNTSSLFGARAMTSRPLVPLITPAMRQGPRMPKRDLVRSLGLSKTGLASSAKCGEWQCERHRELLLSGRHRESVGEWPKNDERSVAAGACSLMGSHGAAVARALEGVRGCSHQRPPLLPTPVAKPSAPRSVPGSP